MNIVDTSLRRPVTVLICSIALVYFGLMAYRTMGMQRIPDVDLPVVMVTTTMDGATAEVMDNDVVDVLEEELAAISGIDSMTSSSYQGIAVTVIEFVLDRDIDAAAADVRDKVNAAMEDLPDEADTPIVEKYDIGDTPLVMATLSGPASYRDKVHFVDKVAKIRLQAISGVGNISTPGWRDREIRIWLDPVRLRSRGLVVQDISDAIAGKHVELPAGSLIIDRINMDLRMEGEYTSVEELKQLPITTRSGVVIRLGDVADVEDGFEEISQTALFNDEETIMIAVRKQRGANEVAVCDAIVAQFEELKRMLPPDMELTVAYNQADFIRRSMSGVAGDAMQAVVLCALLLLFFLQTIRATFVTIVSIPTCLIGSFVLMQAAGVTINNMSMMGISLAVGMVVDATTVVLDNVDRHMKDGKSAMEAASVGTKEVAFSILGGNLTSIAVFAPIAFMGGIIGRFFFAFGITVVLTLSLSLVIALTLAPFLCSRILHRSTPNRAARFCDAIIQGWERSYRKALTWVVHHRKVTMTVTIGIFVFGIFLASLVGTSFMANDDQGVFRISCELPSGTDIEESTRVMKEIARRVNDNPYVRYTTGMVGEGMGEESNKASMYVQLTPLSERPGFTEIMDDLRQTLTPMFRDVTLNFAAMGSKDVEMALVGADTRTLLNVAEGLTADMRATGKFLDIETDVRLDKPQFEVKLNRDMTDAMNVDIQSLTTELLAYFGGVKAGVFKEGGYRYDIRLMSRKDQRRSVDNLQQVAVKNGDGDIVQIPGLLTLEEVLAPSVIKRYSRQTSLTIEANVTSDFSTGQGVELMEQLLRNRVSSDSGVMLIPVGQTKYQQQDFARLRTALIVAISLVYMVMAIQFESFIHPFTVMFSLPLMTPGAFGLLYLTGCKLDLMSYMGIILLIGIVVNNGIILVDFIEQQRAQGVEKIQAVINAGPLRLRAILNTSLTTLIGAIPAVLKLSEGSESRQPMSVALFGGLLTSTLLTLLVIPVVYLIMDDLQERVMRLLSRRRKTSGHYGVREELA